MAPTQPLISALSGCADEGFKLRMLKKLCCLLLGAVGIAQTAGAFSLIGLRPDWQTDRRGYSSDFGPMNIGEEYRWNVRSEEHTSELQSQSNLVCRLLLEKKNKHTQPI